MKIKIIQVKGKTPEERRDKIEEVQNLNELITCKGSVYFTSNKEFYADIYFVQGESLVQDLKLKQLVKKIHSTQKPITDKQAAFLSQLGYKGTYELTSYQASKEIEKLRGRKNERDVTM